MPEQIPPEVRNARRDVSRLVTERNTFLREASRTGSVDHARLNEIDRNIGGLLDDIINLIDPCDASETEPLVLLPVRLETRFGTSGQQTTLRVRIYPDEVHVDDLVRGLTEEEAAAGRAYWAAAWADPVPENAWPALVEAVGGDRAEWVAHVLTPTNLAMRGSAPAPDLPTADQQGPRNIVSRALPDRFVVVAIQGSQVSRGVGRAIPPDLPLSPIPLAGDEPVRTADALTVP